MVRLRFARGHFLSLLAVLLPVNVAIASEYRGRIVTDGGPLPGAIIVATRPGKTVSAVSDATGAYFFSTLEGGTWHVRVEMLGFAANEGNVVVTAGQPPAQWELTMLTLDQALALTKTKVAVLPIQASVVPTSNSPVSQATKQSATLEAPRPQEDDSRPSDRLLVNGSTNNAATSKYSLDQAFGNNRSGTKSLYTGGLAVVVDNSALDARPYSLSGLDSPKSSYNRITGIATIGRPIKIPHLLRHGPNLFLAYEWTRDSTARTEAGLVATIAQRAGDLSGIVDALGKPVTIVNPATGSTFPGNAVPVSPQARATFAVDPNFRVGSAQTWQLAAQRDLPAALQLTATYLGVKGTRGIQQFLPNTYPLGAANLCPACPSGFVYETTNGNSTRQSSQIQLRRRLRSGFTATALYTFSKSVDNDATIKQSPTAILHSVTLQPQ